MKKSKVYDVKSVRLFTHKSSQPILNISAFGTVPTGGWSDASLVPHVYVQPPPDGIYDFDFVATPPEGNAPQVLMPIPVCSTITEIPEGMRGVRIHASTNSVVALFDAGAAIGKTVCIKGKLTDEGVECQALRTANDELYTLVGDLKGFGIGDEVYVSGTIAEFSFCMQGVTIAIHWIGKNPPKC